MSRTLAPAAARASDAVLETKHLGVVYHRGSSLARRQRVEALAGIDCRLHGHEILGIVGPSGSGKSTLGRCLAMHQEPTRGGVLLAGVDVWRLGGAERRRLRPGVQLVAQNPSAALDPRFDVAAVLCEPLRYSRRLPKTAWPAQVDELLRQVDLDPAMAGRPCQQLSGGQKQRLIIARALAAEPRVMVFDEALAAVDAAQRQQLLHLLATLRRRHGLSYVWISHDLATVARWADRILVIDGGRLVEEAPADRLLVTPQHATTRALVEAI